MKADRIIAHIKDQGGGFDYQSYKPDLHVQKNHFQHGIDFMKHLLDDLSFNHTEMKFISLKFYKSTHL